MCNLHPLFNAGITGRKRANKAQVIKILHSIHNRKFIDRSTVHIFRENFSELFTHGLDCNNTTGFKAEIHIISTVFHSRVFTSDIAEYFFCHLHAHRPKSSYNYFNISIEAMLHQGFCHWMQFRFSTRVVIEGKNNF